MTSARTVPSAASPAEGAPRQGARPQRLLVAHSVVRRALLAAAVVPIVLVPAYWETSPWIGLAIGLTVFVVWHGANAAYQAPWIPGAVTLGACVQWVLAPWWIYVLQRKVALPSMAVPAEQYFEFAVPSTLAIVVGIYLPLWRLGGVGDVQSLMARGTVPRSFAKLCELAVWGALATRVVLLPVVPASLRFATYLLSLLALVAVVSQMLLDVPGWKFRAVVVLAVSAIGNASDLQFLEVLCVALCLATTAIFRFRPRLPLLLTLVPVAAAVFLALSAFKFQRRDQVRELQLGGRERAAVTGTAVFQFVRQPTLLFSPEIVGTAVSRLNEGWVTSRILAWVPFGEPYARGETVVTAVRASFVPRIVDPGKYVAGGGEIVPRFTGLTLRNSTSMGLSIPGEMYANFGLLGAWVGTFFYGLGLGLLFRWLLRRARYSLLWLAWIPFVFFSAISVEPALGEVMNGVSKSLLIMWGVVSVVPQWRGLRNRRPQLIAAGALRDGNAVTGVA